MLFRSSGDGWLEEGYSMDEFFDDGEDADDEREEAGAGDDDEVEEAGAGDNDVDGGGDRHVPGDGAGASADTGDVGGDAEPPAKRQKKSSSY